MPRIARQFSQTDIYHAIIRGNDKQDIFYDKQDRFVFINKIKEVKEKFGYQIYSYCLMNNHVHIVFKVKKEFLSKGMQCLVQKYSIYFNKKYNRVGHVFQDRFLSKRIENLTYFLKVCKYIHRNPEKAGIEKTERYYWSSYKEYLNKENIIDKKIMMYYFNNSIEEFKKFTLNNDDIEEIGNLAEFELKKKLTDDDVNEIICKKFKLKNASDVTSQRDFEIKKIIKELFQIKGVSTSQIARVTKNTVYSIKKYLN